jgi:hypothetical protein
MAAHASAESDTVGGLILSAPAAARYTTAAGTQMDQRLADAPANIKSVR